jgi:hypothetical protein
MAGLRQQVAEVSIGLAGFWVLHPLRPANRTIGLIKAESPMQLVAEKVKILVPHLLHARLLCHIEKRPIVQHGGAFAHA